jgi:hypothetical protein
VKKRCPWCGEWKELNADNFNHRGKSERWDSPCKPCKSAYNARYRAANPDKMVKYTARYHEPLEGMPASRGREQWADFKTYWQKNPVHFYIVFRRKLNKSNIVEAYQELMRIMNNKETILKHFFCERG